MERETARDAVVVIVGPAGTAASWRPCCARLNIPIAEAADTVPVRTLLSQVCPMAIVADGALGEAALRDLFTHVRRVPELRLIPILLTGPDSADGKRLRLRTGADGYVPECGGTLALEAHIRRWLTFALRLHKAFAPTLDVADRRSAYRWPVIAGQRE